MGDPKFCRKKYEKPTHPWEADRIKEENELIKKYGLKNKKEVWKAKSMLRRFKRQARTLFLGLRVGEKQALKETNQLLAKLIKLGILNEGATLDDVLALNVESILARRLQTLVYLKGLARTPRQARQFIAHGHASIGDRKVTIPGYLVKKAEEENINYYTSSPLSNELHPMRAEIKPKPLAEAGAEIEKAEK